MKKDSVAIAIGKAINSKKNERIEKGREINKQKNGQAKKQQKRYV